jgi:hypothetical protein
LSSSAVQIRPKTTAGQAISGTQAFWSTNRAFSMLGAPPRFGHAGVLRAPRLPTGHCPLPTADPTRRATPDSSPRIGRPAAGALHVPLYSGRPVGEWLVRLSTHPVPLFAARQAVLRSCDRHCFCEAVAHCPEAYWVGEKCGLDVRFASGWPVELGSPVCPRVGWRPARFQARRAAMEPFRLVARMPQTAPRPGMTCGNNTLRPTGDA